MNALLSARLRQQWPVMLAVLLGVAFLLVHVTVFQPLSDRYRRAIAEAGSLGLMVDPEHPATQVPLSPRLFRLISDNSLSAAEATARSESGALTAEMVQALSAAASHNGLETVVAEPGLLTQQTGTIEMRAHLRLRGRYSGFVSMLDELARGGKLWAVERFAIEPSQAGGEDIEVWMASCVLRRTGGAR